MLKLYTLSEQELLNIINKGRKTRVNRESIFSALIEINYLKRIDKIFNKGLSFYLNPKDPPQTKEASIFFRKTQFGTELNLQAKKIVNQFEELKISLSAIAKLSGIDFERTLPVLSINDNPIESAKKFRNIIKPSFIKGQKDFLKSLINKFSSHNILVFEFIETWNQRERANIDGIFLNPNVIVLKRQDGKSYKREIFTLIHELAHYLLNIEEIENLPYDVLAKNDQNKIEQWCNEFAFYFLLGDYKSTFTDLPFTSTNNDYNDEAIRQISDRTYLSSMAIYTRLLFNNKISYQNYEKIKKEKDNKVKEYYEEQQRKKELDKRKGVKKTIPPPQPIKSNLFISTIQAAFYEGVIDEYQVYKTLKIRRPDKIENYIS